MKPTKKQRRRTRLVIIAIILYGWFLIHHAGGFSTYFPLTGRMFKLTLENTDSIVFINDLGQSTEYSGEELQAVIDAVNSLRYIAWLPDIRPGISGGGGKYRVVIYGPYGSRRMDSFGVGGITVLRNNMFYFMRSGLSALDAFAPAH